jgi:hypothetical protein
MSGYKRVPTAVKYFWTSVDRLVARGTPPPWYKGTVVTPYLLPTSQVPDAQNIEPGATVDVNPSLGRFPLYTSSFVPRGYQWVKIPPGVTGNTIEELCASLLASDPSGAQFPALYYDLTVGDKNWPGGVPIWRLLVDFWENRDYRFALAQARGQDLWIGLSPKFETSIGGKSLTWVLALDPTAADVHVVPSLSVTKTVPPKLAPPKMKVGLNHSWAFNVYGQTFGPHADWIDRWFEQLPENLRIAKYRWGVKHVRMFILCNGYTYGMAVNTSGAVGSSAIMRNPIADTPILRARDAWRFDPPPKLHQKFLDDFSRVLKIFRAVGCEIVPSLLDFPAFAAEAPGGKRDIAADPAKRKIFMDTVLEPFLDVSMSFKDVIYAWEVMNEPSWTTRSFAKPMALDKLGSVFMYTPDAPILTDAELEGFLADAVGRIEARGLPSSVGHRTYDDMQKYSSGKRKQFHFYGWPVMDAPGVGVTATIPKYPLTAGVNAAENIFVGEVGAGDHGRPWPDLDGADENDVRDRVFERLKHVAHKGYPLAFLWGNDAWKPPTNYDEAVDTWEFSNDAILGLTDFTFGLFPDGVP